MHCSKTAIFTLFIKSIVAANYSAVGWSPYLWPGASVGDISYWLKAQQGTKNIPALDISYIDLFSLLQIFRHLISRYQNKCIYLR